MSAEEKVDHAAEAVRVMGLAHDSQNGQYYELAGVELQRAQVHATLAVAEAQNRLADMLHRVTTSGFSGDSISVSRS